MNVSDLGRIRRMRCRRRMTMKCDSNEHEKEWKEQKVPFEIESKSRRGKARTWTEVHGREKPGWMDEGRLASADVDLPLKVSRLYQCLICSTDIRTEKGSTKTRLSSFVEFQVWQINRSSDSERIDKGGLWCRRSVQSVPLPAHVYWFANCCFCWRRWCKLRRRRRRQAEFDVHFGRW